MILGFFGRLLYIVSLVWEAKRSILFVLALGFWLVVRFKALRRAGAVWRTLVAISDEVIT